MLRVVEGDTEKTTINGSERTITNGTDDDGKSYVQNGKAKITSDTDDFGRTTNVMTKVDNSPKFSVNYSYKNVLDNENNPTHRTTNNVNQMIYKLGNDETPLVEYSYSYDKNGNITEICEGTNTIAEYKYDSLNQLQECADKNANKYFVYNYNSGGNITSVDIHSLINGMEKGSLERTETYSYATSGWKDKLVSYKNDSIIYDDIGNPTNYRDGIEMSWSGRELKSLTKSGKTYNFTYNLDGLRTTREKKQGNTVLETVNYYYDDSNNLIGLKKDNTTVLFYYDSEGKVYSMTKGDDTYFFVKNLQGDVTKIIDENGNTCATYAYDAWGALLTENEDSTVEGLNPFRYRGYVYDNETELYYLQSRYYDPKTGRFVNADDSAYTDTYSGSPLSTNMFAYCENNAVNGEDQSGNWDYNDHIKMTANAGFSTTTANWTFYADKWFESDDYYSAPFHSRGRRKKDNGDIVVYGALDCFTYMYNKALNLKQQAKSNKKAVKFKYEESDKVNCFRKKYMGFVKKNKKKELTNTVSTDCSKAKALISSLNNLGTRKQQSQALLGLALHTLQDYYAHLIKVEKCISNGKAIAGIKNMTSLNRVLLPSTSKIKQNDEIEDNKSFLGWRYSAAKWATKNFVYDCYTNNRTVNKLSVYYKVKRELTFYIQWINENKKIGYYRKNKRNGYSKYKILYYEPTLYADVSNGWGYVF